MPKKRFLVWRPIPGFKDYEVTEFGDIRRRTPGGGRCAVGYMLSPQQHPEPPHYLYATIKVEGLARTLKFHRAVALAFRAPGCGPLVRHLDGDAQNNWIGNLRWGTDAENHADRRRHLQQHRTGTWRPNGPPPRLSEAPGPAPRTTLGVRGGREWRTVPGAKYAAISEDGALMLLPTDYDLNAGVVQGGTITSAGYLAYTLRISGVRGIILAHRLVAAAFLPTEQHRKAVVRHLNDNKSNNHYTNLAYGSQADNMADMRRNGTAFRKVTDADVVAIRRDQRRLADIARDYGISISAASYIRMGVSFSAVAEPPQPARRKGEANRKLTEKQVRAALVDPRPSTVVAQEFGVSSTVIKNLRAGKTWQHLRRPSKMPLWPIGRPYSQPR